MTEPKVRATRAADDSPPPAAEARSHDDAERSLGRLVAVGFPAASLACAVVAGALAGVGSALLVLAAGALLGTIALLWASLRTLSGDAPLALELEGVGARRHGLDALGERKRRLLRALKDLQGEHALGKIDDQDYGLIAERYREEAKTVMRQMDLQVAPQREQAEKLAAAYVARSGAPEPEPKPKSKSRAKTGEARAAEVAPSGRLPCAQCGASNEGDAAFCKQCGRSLDAKAKADR